MDCPVAIGGPREVGGFGHTLDVGVRGCNCRGCRQLSCYTVPREEPYPFLFSTKSAFQSRGAHISRGRRHSGGLYAIVCKRRDSDQFLAVGKTKQIRCSDTRKRVLRKPQSR